MFVVVIFAFSSEQVSSLLLLLQQKKLADKLAKAVKDVEKTKGIYEASLKDLSTYNPKYMEDMTEVSFRHR